MNQKATTILLRTMFLFSLIVNVTLLKGQTEGKEMVIHFDSLPMQLNDNWKFTEADSAIMSSPEYDDSHWKKGKSSMLVYSQELKDFKGKAWFRLHFKTDSAFRDISLAIIMEQNGASEVYLDGKRILVFGTIKGGDSSVYRDPSSIPHIIPNLAPGEHLFAVRYENLKASKNYEVYNSSHAGFEMILGTSEYLIDSRNSQNVAKTFLCTLLVGLFGALSFLHFLLWLFYRKDKSNLYFSAFAFALMALFALCFILLVTGTPKIKLISSYLLTPMVVTLFIALNNFIYALFQKKRRVIYWVIAVSFLINLVLFLSSNDDAPLVSLGIIIAISIESIIHILSAIMKKVPGARIIGAGVLFFTVFLLSMLITAIFKQEIQLGDGTFGETLLLLTACLALLSIPISMSVYLSWNFSRVNRNLSDKLVEVQELSQKTIEQELEKVKLISSQNEMLENKVEERTLELRNEKKKSDDLLLNILPEEVANELKNTGKATAKLYNHVTVLFTDFVNFTGISETLSPNELVDEIDRCFKAFDAIMEANGLEKIKTIGDAYLAVCGLPNEAPDHAVRTVKAAVQIRDFMNTSGGKFQIRIGIHSGSVVAGIVGVKKYAYDIWGDTVNTAARMEQNSESGKINISGATYALLGSTFQCSHRGKIQAKNKGEIDMYFVD